LGALPETPIVQPLSPILTTATAPTPPATEKAAAEVPSLLPVHEESDPAIQYKFTPEEVERLLKEILANALDGHIYYDLPFMIRNRYCHENLKQVRLTLPEFVRCVPRDVSDLFTSTLTEAMRTNEYKVMLDLGLLRTIYPDTTVFLANYKDILSAQTVGQDLIFKLQFFTRM